MTPQDKSLFLAMELSNTKWRLRFSDGSKERERAIDAQNWQLLLKEIAIAKEKLGLPATTRVVACYEAGRDGFWIARMFAKNHIECKVMDPASIEVPRRSRIRKTDRLDVQKLLKLLLRAEIHGEKKVYSVVRVPTEEQEMEMRRERERERLVKERTGHRARMMSLCSLLGYKLKNPSIVVIDEIKDWEQKPLAGCWLNELKDEQRRLHMVEEQIKALEAKQKKQLEQVPTPTLQKAKKLLRIRAVGRQSALILAHECFWRDFRNRRQVGSFAGLTGTPYDSGDTLREQGISKAGNRRVRTTMIELAWGWVRWQPQSALTHWFIDHYVASGTSRSKRKGIVALARKLLVALWKYLEHDIMPEGAVLRA